MTEQTQDFFHHYRAMDTRVLLARYRSGGLLPEAEAALREVLADRGCDVEALGGKGADGIATLYVDETAASPSISMKAGGPPPVGWRGLKQKSIAIALQVKEEPFRRETWAQVARFGLLAVCLWAAQLASLFGMGFFVVANVFCDSGPEVKCFHMGLHFLEVGLAADLLLIPAMIALLFPKKWIAWYLKAVPVLSLAVFAAAVHWYRVLPMFCSTAAKLSALIAVLATAYLILSRRSVVVPMPESA
ncbi:hypothetical protein [Rhodanobacter sp. DHG33]|uniref:hypothetical protein n=1 Tax=Rhodanobacter sp. DHG33 TaxID=2775921 RepID=UPI00177CFEFD|nr:hypothetical protein [Rhodanobacter sp. DHG33]MBD8900198.1 hypothetical protein [Rhodanobacter sp. DHG33]